MKRTPQIADLLAKSAPMTDEERERQQASLTRGARSGGRDVEGAMTDIKREEVVEVMSRATTESLEDRVVRAACEEWLEARRARWVMGEAALDGLPDACGVPLVSKAGGEHGLVWRRSPDQRYGWRVGPPEDRCYGDVDSREEAQAIVEAWAIAKGYEIVRAP